MVIGLEIEIPALMVQVQVLFQVSRFKRDL